MAAQAPSLRISERRLAADLGAVNRFGATPAGGAQRLAWTDDEVAARAWLAERCRAIGLALVEHDEAGNVWAHSGEPRAVFMGSHLDTVPNGGRFDGAVGVVSALEVLRAAHEAGIPEARRLGLVCWTDEEGARFGTGMLGSRAVAGLLTPAEIERGFTVDGTTLVDELRRNGIEPTRVPAAAARRGRIATYLELHIEQGARLERAGLAVGVVTGIVGVSNWRIRVHGVANHAGATRPEDRHDALIPVAKAAVAAQRAMRSRDGLVATVGEAAVVGGASNIVPGEARCTLDIRSQDQSSLDAAVTEILGTIRESARDNGCRLDELETKRMPPALAAPEAIAAFEAAAGKEGIATIRLPSAAAHDGMNLAAAGVPIGMVFVRSQAGISHAPQERSTIEDCAAATRVFAGGALRLARELA